MAGQIKANQIQLGDSTTATQNFVLQTNVDGTAKLARGNVGSTTQDILTVDAAGKLGMIVPPVNAANPCFSAYLGITQSISSTTQTLVQCNTKIFDTTNAFNNTGAVVGGIPAYAFMPQIAGYYSVDAILAINGTAVSAVVGVFYKNGAQYSDPLLTQNSVTTPANFSFRELIFLNGSTDYIQLYGQINGTTPSFLFSTTNNTAKFSAALISRSA